MVVVSEFKGNMKMIYNSQEPVAWAFYHPDGTLRFIIDDKTRMEAWKSAHDGLIVPLVHQVSNIQTDRDSNSMVE